MSNFTPVCSNNIIKYPFNYKGINFEYLYKSKDSNTVINQLKIKVNPSKILNKQMITNLDYIEFVNEYKKIFFKLFKFTSPDHQLNRIDYKKDIITEHKGTYLKLISKSKSSFRSLEKQNYKSSTYYNSKSVNINNYDKEQERKDKGDFNISDYENMLRLEIQIKPPKINYFYNQYGLCKELFNYWDITMHDLFFKEYMEKVLFKGDYYNLYHSEKILKKYYRTDTVNKMLNIQKIISTKGIERAEELYNMSYYIPKFNNAGVNPVPIPKAEGITHLNNLVA